MAQQGTGRSNFFSGAETTSSIPDKLYFRIGEVAELCGVPTYVLRFWESEFPQLRPNKGGTGQRLYRRKDVETVLRIRNLLYAGKFTIPGARQALRIEQEQRTPQLPLVMPHSEAVEPDGSPIVDLKLLGRLQQDLRELREMLSSPPAAIARRGSVQPIRAERVTDAGQLSEDLFS